MSATALDMFRMRALPLLNRVLLSNAVYGHVSAKQHQTPARTDVYGGVHVNSAVVQALFEHGDMFAAPHLSRGVQARDPIPQFRSWALAEGLLTEAQVKEIDQSVTEEVEDAVKFADESPKPVRHFLV